MNWNALAFRHCFLFFFQAWSSDTENDSFQAKLVVSQYVRGDVSLSSGKDLLKHFWKLSYAIPSLIQWLKNCCCEQILIMWRSLKVMKSEDVMPNNIPQTRKLFTHPAVENVYYVRFQYSNCLPNLPLIRVFNTKPIEGLWLFISIPFAWV